MTGLDLSGTEGDVADWDFRVEQEREQFKLYEQRRLSVELQATAVTAAALTIAALLIAGQEKLSAIGALVEYGISLAIVGLVLALVCASLARFASWRTSSWLGRPEPRQDEEVGKSLERYRQQAARDDLDSMELRALAHAHWHARALSAWKLGDFKDRWLRRSAGCLAVSVAFLALVAAMQLWNALG